MLPHPIIASEDDEEYVTRTILNLPQMMVRLFDGLDALYLHEESEENGAIANFLYFTIRRHLQILSAVPAESFRLVESFNGIDQIDDPSSRSSKHSVKVPKLLYSLNKIFAGDMIKVDPKALLWKSRCIGLANECAEHMRQSCVHFSRRQQIHRAITSPQKNLFGFFLFCFFLAVLLAEVVIIAVPIIGAPHQINLHVGIPAAIILLVVSAIMIFYYVKVSKALDLLYHQVFQLALTPEGCFGFSGTVGTGVPLSARNDSVGMEQMTFGKENYSGAHAGLGELNDMKGRDLLSGYSSNGSAAATGGIAGVGSGGGNNASWSGNNVCNAGSGVSTGLGTGVSGAARTVELAKRALAKNGYYTIAYGGDIGYIDGRQLDSQVVMIAYDQNYRITRWNNAAEVLTGYLQDGCVGKPLHELVQSPAGFRIEDELLCPRKGKPIKVKLCSLATPPSVFHTIVSPIVNPNNETIGHMLICANSTDNLRPYRSYLHHYANIQVVEALNQLFEHDTLTVEDRTHVVLLGNFVLNCSSVHIDELARDMTTEWEWTNADQLLSRAFGESLGQHSCAVHPQFPSTICVSPFAYKALGVVAAKRGACNVNLSVSIFKVAVFVLCIAISFKGKRDKVEWEELVEIEESIAAPLRGAAGIVTGIEDRIILTFPCQVSPIIDDEVEEEDNPDGTNLLEGRSIVNCTVNVVTMIRNMIDQYNLSVSLLKTMLVTLANVRDRNDLEQRLRAQPCEVDVIICDGEFLSSCRDLLMSNFHAAIVIPFVSSQTVISTAQFSHVIRAPIVGRVIYELMVNVGQLVANRKNAIIAQEEREHILTVHQDSPWTKGRLLGRGNQGAVYEATSDLTGGKMAVKMFYFNNAQSESSINHLLNEVKIMCSLNHPHIVHYFHSERSERGVNLFMELCEGSLTDIILHRLRRPEHLGVLQIIRQVLDALTYLHGRGVAHRDVKPQNILLKGDIIKLTDFGAAREGSATKEVGGTVRYMAPEVYRGRDHSLPCDIWSTGCLLCELLGCPPAFMDDSVLLGNITYAIPYLKNVPANPLLHDFLKKCFEVEPEKRVSSQELLAHPLLRVDAPCSDIEAQSVLSGVRHEVDQTFSICSQ